MNANAINTLALAVAKEATNYSGPKGVAKLYATAAGELVAVAADAAAVHLYLSAAQDATTDPTVWKRSMQGIRDAIKPLGYAIVTTRDFRPAYRVKNPMFTVALIAAVKAARDAANATATAQVDAIESAAAALAAEESAAADASTTAKDVAQATIAECERLGLRLAEVSEYILRYINTSALTPSVPSVEKVTMAAA